MGGQGYSDTLEAILYLRDEIGPMGLLTTPTFTRSLALLSLGSNGTSLVEDWLNLYLRNSLGNNFRDCQRSRYSDLVYVLWTMANLLPSRPVVPGERRWSSSFEDIFECVHSHSKEILSSTEVRKHNWALDFLKAMIWRHISLPFHSWIDGEEGKCLLKGLKIQMRPHKGFWPIGYKYDWPP